MMFSNFLEGYSKIQKHHGYLAQPTHDHSYYNILQRGNTDPLTCKDVLYCTVHYSHSYYITHSALYEAWHDIVAYKPNLAI